MLQFWTRLYRDVHGKMLKFNKNFLMNDEFISKLNIIPKIQISRWNLGKVTEEKEKWMKERRREIEGKSHLTFRRFFLRMDYDPRYPDFRFQFVVFIRKLAFKKSNKSLNIIFGFNLMSFLRFFFQNVFGNNTYRQDANCDWNTNN